MTGILYLENEPHWTRPYTMRPDENGLIGAKLHVGNGDTVREVDLFYSSLVGSANNATLALARSVGLSDEGFVRDMNAKAKDFKLDHTHFTDPTGLDPENVSSVKDLAVMARYAFSFPEIKKATTQTNHEMRSVAFDEYHNVRSTNNMLKSGDFNISGSKTGYLDEAGYCLITQIRNDAGRELISVIVGATSHHQRFYETQALLKWSGEHFVFDAISENQ